MLLLLLAAAVVVVLAVVFGGGVEEDRTGQDRRREGGFDELVVTVDLPMWPRLPPHPEHSAFGLLLCMSMTRLLSGKFMACPVLSFGT